MVFRSFAVGRIQVLLRMGFGRNVHRLAAASVDACCCGDPNLAVVAVQTVALVRLKPIASSPLLEISTDRFTSKHTLFASPEARIHTFAPASNMDNLTEFFDWDLDRWIFISAHRRCLPVEVAIFKGLARTPLSNVNAYFVIRRTFIILVTSRTDTTHSAVRVAILHVRSAGYSVWMPVENHVPTTTPNRVIHNDAATTRVFRGLQLHHITSVSQGFPGCSNAVVRISENLSSHTLASTVVLSLEIFTCVNAEPAQ